MPKVRQQISVCRQFSKIQQFNKKNKSHSILEIFYKNITLHTNYYLTSKWENKKQKKYKSKEKVKFQRKTLFPKISIFLQKILEKYPLSYQIFNHESCCFLTDNQKSCQWKSMEN